MNPLQKIQQDFDRIAALSEHGGVCGGTYDRFLLRFIPAPCDRALEVGCGTGSFTQALAGRANRVIAIDLSAEMIRVALRRSSAPNIEYRVGDILQADLPEGYFDCIVMAATLHHLPVEAALVKLKRALAPGGVMIIHDLLTSSGILDKATDPLRLLAQTAARWLRARRLRDKPEVRQAWRAHGERERYLTRAEVKAMRERYLDGAYVKYHLLWRYTVVWKRQDTT